MMNILKMLFVEFPVKLLYLLAFPLLELIARSAVLYIYLFKRNTVYSKPCHDLGKYLGARFRVKTAKWFVLQRLLDLGEELNSLLVVSAAHYRDRNCDYLVEAAALFYDLSMDRANTYLSISIFMEDILNANRGNIRVPLNLQDLLCIVWATSNYSPMLSLKELDHE